jgi:prolyl-tRNA editing enzyme YbaK/EbsC (Cys-tRNA(Pro) deacylase)
MDYHPVTAQILGLLKTHTMWHETFRHEPVLTSEEAAKTRPGYTLHQGAKAIIAKVEHKNKEEKYVMFVIPADLRLDSKKIKTNLDCRSIRFATEEELSTITNGVQRGAVPPFGTLFGIEVYADTRLCELEKIVFNAGDRRFSIAMKTADFLLLVQPHAMDIVSH